MKTGCYPMRSRLQLFLECGIHFEEPYVIAEQAARKVEYSNKKEIEYDILLTYPFRSRKEKENADGDLHRETECIRT